MSALPSSPGSATASSSRRGGTDWLGDDSPDLAARALYACVPPLALNLQGLLYQESLPMLHLVAIASLAMVALLAKGSRTSRSTRARYGQMGTWNLPFT
jgi:hypothetical protein